MRTSQSRGFTLVELSVLMVVAGVVLATTVGGTMHLVRTSRLIGTTNTLLADLRYARTLAATERSEFQIRFESDRYSIVRVSPLRTVISRVSPPGVSFAADDTASFYAWGLVTPVTISVTSCTGSNYVQMSATGSVSRD